MGGLLLFVFLLNPNVLQVSVLLQKRDETQSNSNPIAVGPEGPNQLSAVGVAKPLQHALVQGTSKGQLRSVSHTLYELSTDIIQYGKPYSQVY